MLQLFFSDNLTNPKLIEDNAHHAMRVLRMAVGEYLLLSDGQGNWAKCQIKNLSKREVDLEVVERGQEPPMQSQISVVQAIPKSERAKEAVELLTASGAFEIFPWQASRSIGRDSHKWEIAAIEAAKQSRRFTIPKVHQLMDTKEIISRFADFSQILICHESATSQISEVVKPATKTLIVIGPEGGISDEELHQFQDAGGALIKLGRPVLRSAHAGLAAVSAVSALMKVW